jgi:hypothetical protein
MFVLAEKVFLHFLHKNLCFFNLRIVGVEETSNRVILDTLKECLMMELLMFLFPQHGQLSGL